MVFIFFSDDSHLSAKPFERNLRAGREVPVTLNNTTDHLELRSADVDAALERYFEEIRKNPERGEEDLRLVDELVPDDLSAPEAPPDDTNSKDATEKKVPADAKAIAQPPGKKPERVVVHEHEVKPGESIWRLAKKYNVSIATIVSANKLKEKAVIQPGDSLRIPDRNGIFHKPSKKENLGEIARRYKISAEAIKRANSLAGNFLPAGKEVFLPGAKPLPEIQYIRQKVFSWPIRAKNRLTSGFGWRVHPLTGSRAFHTGIDIGAASGTPILAAADGVVVFSGDGGSYGNMVILRHKNGLYTVYGHASKLIAKKGKYVKRGQKIALVGSTGASTGPHLHFEVKSTEKHVNPKIAFKKTERVAVKRRA